jgi:hypothetical protein
VRALAAVLLVGPDTDSYEAPLVRIFHPSFRDFLLERCINELFSIKEPLYHHKLAIYCLRSLNGTLKRDICDIQNPTLSNADILSSPLSICIRDFVPETIRYACQFWVIHLSQSEAPEGDLLEAMQIFASKHLFHWVELLSLIGLIFFTIQNLPEFNAWCKVSQLPDVE